MADTTVKRVKAIASHLAELEEETIQMYIDDAKIRVPKGLKSDYIEIALRYLSAHLATLDYRRATREEIKGELSVSFEGNSAGGGQPNSFETTSYGREYMSILKENMITFSTV